MQSWDDQIKNLFSTGIDFFSGYGKRKRKRSFFGYLWSIQMSQPFNQAKVRVLVLINQNTSAIN